MMQISSLICRCFHPFQSVKEASWVVVDLHLHVVPAVGTSTLFPHLYSCKRLVVDSREWAGSNLGNPEFSFLNLHFALLATRRALRIVDAKPVIIIVSICPMLCLLASNSLIFVPPSIRHVGCSGACPPG